MIKYVSLSNKVFWKFEKIQGIMHVTHVYAVNGSMTIEVRTFRHSDEQACDCASPYKEISADDFAYGIIKPLSENIPELFAPRSVVIAERDNTNNLTLIAKA